MTNESESAKPEEIAATEENTNTVPNELLKKIDVLRAIATAHNLLDKGHFPHSHHEAIKLCLSFLKALHENAVEEATSDPEAEKVPELKQLIDLKKEKTKKENKVLEDVKA